MENRERPEEVPDFYKDPLAESIERVEKDMKEVMADFEEDLTKSYSFAAYSGQVLDKDSPEDSEYPLEMYQLHATWQQQFIQMQILKELRKLNQQISKMTTS